VFAGQTHLFEVGSSTTVADVKELVQSREGECLQRPAAAAAASGAVAACSLYRTYMNGLMICANIQ
jgi:hypothetical protein